MDAPYFYCILLVRVLLVKYVVKSNEAQEKLVSLQLSLILSR